ncbi:methyltransferase domain-containing protein [Qingshengfaniella alkalisoli]|uniref:Class I SAM-dependent methyltransferase n=1 Tax=Qingshengfaniella alkalisoli TaxID=2599296 RepID=A0A5B8ISM4_9RHOB|nr:methyltransferase domain-containing protein [Qingshengfaniella alkalisoli]QDY68433.1 class I SAM-dependent methyltransferase [Qingshengfaniella alkalisoli]
MRVDVLDLRTFYYRTGLGRAAQRAIRGRLLDLWPEAKGQSVVGYGFAVPLLRPYLVDARRVLGLMPAQQGVMPWPMGMPNVSLLCEEVIWPLSTGMADKLIVHHGLETSDHPADLLDECYRVLGPGGRAMFIVPNRAGLWARSERTPLGHGRPYSLTQLEALLKRHGFMPERHAAALFQPPSHRRFWLRAGGLCERVGQRLSNHYAGGVLMVEAGKQVFAPGGRLSVAEKPRMAPVLEGLHQPTRVASPGHLRGRAH